MNSASLKAPAGLTISSLGSTATASSSSSLGQLQASSSLPLPSSMSSTSTPASMPSPPNLGRTVSFSQLQLNRNSSATNPRIGLSVGGMMAPDWRSMISIEDRQNVRARLLDNYRRNCATYEELLSMVAAIDEEMLFYAATTRLDYFKTAIDFDNRLQIKRKQFNGELGVGTLERQLLRSRSVDPTLYDSQHQPPHHQQQQQQQQHFASDDIPAAAPLTSSSSSSSTSSSSSAGFDNPLLTLATATVNNNDSNHSAASTSSSSSGAAAAAGTGATNTRLSKRRNELMMTSSSSSVVESSSPHVDPKAAAATVTAGTDGAGVPSVAKKNRQT